MNITGRPSIDTKRFRALMGSFATGVAIVTTAWRNNQYGMTISSLTSVSLDPFLLLICPRRGSATGAAITNSGLFAVNVLARQQQILSHRFVSDMDDRFKDIEVTLSKDGLPLLSGCIAHACCSVTDIHKGGDHDIVVARVIESENFEGDPLVLFRGVFGIHRPEI